MKRRDEIRSPSSEKDTLNSKSNPNPKHTLASSKETYRNDDEWNIPLPPSFTSSQYNHRSSNSSTPLLSVRQRQRQRQPPYQDRTRDTGTSTDHSLLPSIQHTDDDDVEEIITTTSASASNPFLLDVTANMNPMNTTTSTVTSMHDEPRPRGLSGFFFGFMYEEPFEESFDYLDSSHDSSEEHATPAKGSIWNSLNMTLFAAYALTTAATTVPVLIIPTIGKIFLTENDASDASGFSSRAAASAVMGTACGKFLNGPMGDVFGARRTSVLFSILLSFALLAMGFCDDIPSVTWACFFVEFFQSVQWPCMLIMLATHYGPQQRYSSKPSSNNHAMYERGIYITSMASRFGSLIGIPFFSSFLRHDDESSASSQRWRWVCFLGAWMAMVAASISYLLFTDSPHSVNEPQNPLHPTLLRQLADMHTKPRRLLRLIGRVFYSVAFENIFPSLKHVLRSGTFWIVALAHTGSSMIRTSERILSTYFHDTSMGYLSQEKASGLSIFASLGTIMGLAVCGTFFTSLTQERQRKVFVSRLYMLTIASCYGMALFAIPTLHQAMDAPGLVLFFQIFASFCMSLGIAVMFYQIPGLVGTNFGNHKGLFSAYVDGVAYGISSFVWKIVASTVSADNGSSGGAGWAYGWAAVALLVILCAILMVEFMEHYFVRPSRRHQLEGGAYETIMLA